MRLETTRATGAGLFLASLLGLIALSNPAVALSDRETRSQEFELSKVKGHRKLIVDTVWGTIRVTGREGLGDIVKMKLTKRIEAPSQISMNRARAEVALEIFTDPASLELFVNGPWRDPDDRHEWARHSVDRDYEVTYDFELEVPKDTDLRLKSVLNGDIEIIGVEGRHDVSNVTGDVAFRDVGGSGRFETVSGSVSGSFSGQPDGPSRWKTVSGNVEVTLASDLDADLLLVSKWGDIWSEFPIDPLPAMPARSSTIKGKYVIRTDRGARFRVGEGGAELHFETLSGDIKIRKNKGD